jgi:hypothetical protein
VKITGCRATVSVAASFYRIKIHCPVFWDGKDDKDDTSQETCHIWIDEAFARKRLCQSAFLRRNSGTCISFCICFRLSIREVLQRAFKFFIHLKVI